MLTAALAGFFLVLEFLVSLLSSGPQDILAETTWQVDTVGLPNGVGLLESAVLGVSLVLAVAVFIASVGWPLTKASFRPSLRLAIGRDCSPRAGGRWRVSCLLGRPWRERRV